MTLQKCWSTWTTRHSLCTQMKVDLLLKNSRIQSTRSRRSKSGKLTRQALTGTTLLWKSIRFGTKSALYRGGSRENTNFTQKIWKSQTKACSQNGLTNTSLLGLNCSYLWTSCSLSALPTVYLSGWAISVVYLTLSSWSLQHWSIRLLSFT